MADAAPPSAGPARTWVGAALAVTLPVVLAASGASTALPGGQALRGNGGWSSASWMGDATSTGSTTLAQIRAAIGAGAGTGTAAGLTGAGVGIALIDTGVANVPGLPAAQIVNGPDLSFESQAPALRYQDTYGHGTHMAGIIVGNDTATGTVGIAPKAKITSIKVGISNGAVDVSQVIAAIDWAVQNRNHDPANPIRVINLSYRSGGTASWGGDTMHYAVEQAWKAGIVVVASAGNDGLLGGLLNLTTVTNPAEDRYVIAAGATSTMGTASTLDDTLAGFTNTHWLRTGRQPDLLAPGTSVVSLRDPGSAIDQTYPAAAVGETLFRGSGTSQSAAVISASVALLLQHRPALTPDQVKRILMDSGTDIKVGSGENLDLGQVNVAAALVKATPTSTQSYTRSSGSANIESSRGSQHVVHGTTKLTGEKSVYGPMSTSAWVKKSGTQTAWAQGVWMGFRVAGDGWTGTSWASKTWGDAAWAGKPWSGAASWQDPDWAGRYWAGRYWAGRYWAGRYWCDSGWSTSHWG